MGLTEDLISGLQQRVAHALLGWTKLMQEAASQGQVSYAPPPMWNHTAAIDAIVKLLIDSGFFTEQQFVLQALTNQAEMLEKSLREAADHYREATGVIVPLGISGRPQG